MESINGHIHPLEVPLIMDLILDYIPFSNWKIIRLVSKAWYSRVQNRWRDETFVIITPPVLKELSSNHPTRNSEDPYHVRERPPRNFRTNRSRVLKSAKQHVLDPVVVGVEQLFFWQSFGPWLKRLHLVRAQVPHVLFFEKLIYELTPNLEELYYIHCRCIDVDSTSNLFTNNFRVSYTPPRNIHNNLKTFHYHYAYYSKVSRLFPMKWIDFLCTCQHIEKLKMIIDIYPDHYTTTLLKAVEVIRNANGNKVLNLTEFSAPNQVYPNSTKIINSLCRLSLPLSTLALNISKVTEDEVAKLIQSHQNTLERLTLTKSTYRSSPNFTSFAYHVFPKKLKKLTCTGLVFPTLGFLEYTPNLEELEILSGENDDVISDFRQRRINPLCHLKTMRYTTVDLRVSEELVKIMTGLMPNLTTVTIHVEHGGFVEVCSKWTALETATLGLIQITESQFVKNITNLQELKSLELYCFDDKFKDAAIYDGFLKLPKLTKLSVVLSSEVTPEAVETLREKIKDTTGTQLRTTLRQ